MKELKVGQQFEVVEILDNDNPYNEYSGYQIVKVKEMFFSAYISSFGSYNSSCPEYKKTCLLSDNEVKPIGKLTITKLK